MKKTLIVTGLVLGAMAGQVKAEDNTPESPWSAELTFMAAELESSSVSGAVKTNDIFDDTNLGFEISALRDINENTQWSLGFNTVHFKGQSTRDSLLNTDVDTDDLEALSLFTGIRWHYDLGAKTQLQLRGNVGWACLEDVDEHFGSLGTLESLRGGSGLYFDYGIGLKFKMREKTTLNIGWTMRDYGQLKGGSASNPSLTVMYDDVDARVQSFDFGVTYRW